LGSLYHVFFAELGSPNPSIQPEAIYKVPTAGWLQIFALAGAIEAKNIAFPTRPGDGHDGHDGHAKIQCSQTF